jgi:type I restriction enzyme S subunit
MKYSGVEWIGKIPNRWEVKTLSILLREHNKKNKSLLNKNLLSLSYGRIVEKDIQTKGGLLPENFEGYNIISSGDIVLRLTDLQNDHKSLRVGFCSYNGIITSAYVTLRSKTQDIFSKYYYYLLHSFDIKKGFYGMGDGVRQNLSYDGLRTLPLLLPPKEVQNQISHFLDIKCSSIDKVINIKEQKIEKLNEYKKSLIYEYVTGKRTVEL